VSCPCTGHSTANAYADSDKAKKARHLLVAVARLAIEAEHPPLCLVCENVHGMIKRSKTKEESPEFTEMKRIMTQEGGYSAETFVVDTKFMGLPTERTRVFVIFTKPGVTTNLGELYAQTRTEKPTVLSDLAYFRGEPQEVQQNHNAARHSPDVRKAGVFEYPRRGHQRAISYDNYHGCLRTNSGYAPSQRWREERTWAIGRSKGDFAPIADTRSS
jgi:site-specific DNA-cytosine methylase